MQKIISFLLVIILFCNCSKKEESSGPVVLPVAPLELIAVKEDGSDIGTIHYNTSLTPTIKFYFNEKVDIASASSGILLKENNATSTSYNLTSENNDSTIVLIPAASLKALTKY